MQTKKFGIRAILSVTTGYLLTKSKSDRDNGIGDMYDILGWMANDSPSTRQLGRFADECKPWLLRWFPELAAADAFLADLDKAIDGARAGNFDKMKTDLVIQGWIDRVVADTKIKESYDVPRIPVDDHDRIDPCEELVAMIGAGKDIVAVAVNDNA